MIFSLFAMRSSTLDEANVRGKPICLFWNYSLFIGILMKIGELEK
jgi:hypothetical protein